MSARLLRRALVILLAGAFVAATVLQISLSASAAGSDTTKVEHDRGDGNSMPCEGIPFNCLSDLGCIFLVSLPAPQLTISTGLAWSPVVYAMPSDAARGRSIKPDLGPPIRSA